MYDVRENEHQELFHLGIDPTRPIAMHIPSPLGALGYYLFVRVPAATAQRLGNVSARFDLIGLHETHVTMAPGEGVTGEATSPCREDGLVWHCLGMAKVARGNGTLELREWPADITAVDLLLCTWPRFVTSGMADDWIAAQADPHWTASGVPLGGIGGGRVDICRDGRFRNFSMNNNQDSPLEDPDGLPGTYLAVAVNGHVTDLASRAIVAGHQSCQQLEFEPRFPQATLRAPDVFPGVDVAVTLSGTLCPHDLRRSSIPGFLIHWRVTNTGSTDRVVRCQFGWPNLIGIGGGVASFESGIGYGDGYYHHWDDPTGREEKRLKTKHYLGVRYTGTPGAEYTASAGEHLAAVMLEDGMKVDAHAGSGKGVIIAELTIPAGESATATMAVVTAMPHWVDAFGEDRGRYWQNNFADGDELLAALMDEQDDILQEASALAALLGDSTLPSWLWRRLNNCNYPLVTNSVLYRDGRFSINEGPTEMAGCYGTIDQRLAAHPATQLLFPQLNATELGLFAAIQGENGGISHDLGSGHLERKPGEVTWPDLTCSFVIQCARHSWSTGDAAFEDAMWPRVKRALQRHGQWADEGAGVAQVGTGLGTSYDSYHYIGTTAYMGTLWLAALAVCEKWSVMRNDAELLRDIPRWREAARRRLEEDLWNGRYFNAYGNTAGVRRDTCHAGQLAGEVFARLLCGVHVMDEEHLLSCIDALLSLNGSERFAIPPDEVSPDGQAGSDFGWVPYVEGFMLSAIATEKDERLWPLWQRTMHAVERDGHPCDTRLMYHPSDGGQTWGTYYMTASASWLVYDAWLDFFYAPDDGVLRLRAGIPGRYPLVHPRFWGTVDMDEYGSVSLTLQRVFADVPLYLTAIEVPEDVDGVELEGQPLNREPGQGDYVQYQLPTALLLQEGMTLRWQANLTVSV